MGIIITSPYTKGEVMGRHAEFNDEELKEKLKQISSKYGSLSVDSLKKASKEDPKNFPSYKMFERRFGGIKNIKKLLSGQSLSETSAVKDKQEILS